MTADTEHVYKMGQGGDESYHPPATLGSFMAHVATSKDISETLRTQIIGEAERFLVRQGRERAR